MSSFLWPILVIHISFSGGFFQSVVLLSKLPFVALFSHLVGVVAPEYFENGEATLEAGEYKPYRKSRGIPGMPLVTNS